MTLLPKKNNKIFIIFIALFNISYGQQPSLIEATVRDNLPLVQFLLNDKNADPNQSTSDGMTALFFAQDPKIALALLKAGADISQTNMLGATPLHFAVSYSNDTVTKLLLEFGADPNTQDHKGNTPLHTSVKSNPDVIVPLLEHGANIDLTNQSKQTPFQVATNQGNILIAQYFTKDYLDKVLKDKKITASILPEIEKEATMSIGLLEKAIDPLIRAIYVEDYPEALRLIRNKNSLKEVDAEGNTALHWAIRRKNRYIAHDLIKNNSPYDIKNKKNQTAIDELENSTDKSFIRYIKKLIEEQKKEKKK